MIDCPTCDGSGGWDVDRTSWHYGNGSLNTVSAREHGILATGSLPEWTIGDLD